MKKKKYTREELIRICEDAVVSCSKWHDRDSHMAQMEISDIHSLLCIGCDYVIDKNTNENTIYITFKNITVEQKSNSWKNCLSIDSVEDYFNWYRNEYGEDCTSEMFEGHGIDLNSNYWGGYMPTRKRLEEANGGDWC